MESAMADDEPLHQNLPEGAVSGAIHQDTARLDLAASSLLAVSPASSPAIKSGILPVWKGHFTATA
jgi:hypothetical protein